MDEAKIIVNTVLYEGCRMVDRGSQCSCDRPFMLCVVERVQFKVLHAAENQKCEP